MTKVKEIAKHPVSIVSMLFVLLTGSGGFIALDPFLQYVWEPVKSYIQEVSIRQDITIYLLCDENEECVEDAWDKVIERRIYNRMRKR